MRLQIKDIGENVSIVDLQSLSWSAIAQKMAFEKQIGITNSASLLSTVNSHISLYSSFSQLSSLAPAQSTHPSLHHTPLHLTPLPTQLTELLITHQLLHLMVTQQQSKPLPQHTDMELMDTEPLTTHLSVPQLWRLPSLTQLPPAMLTHTKLLPHTQPTTHHWLPTTLLLPVEPAE